MADFNAQRVGQINQAGDAKAIFLKLFAGEVLNAFEIENVMMSRAFTRTIEHGKSVSWPRIGRASGAKYHTPGTQLDGEKINKSEIIGVIDDLLVSDIFIPKIDDAMNHYEVRSRYSRLLAVELSNILDKHTMVEGLKGARLTAPGTELPTEIPTNGAVVGPTAFRENDLFVQASEVTGGAGNAASVEAKIDAIRSACYAAAARFDMNKVPEEGRYILLRPQEYRQCAEAIQSSGFSLTNSDYNTNGSETAGKVGGFAGFELVMSTQMPGTDLGSTGTASFHGGDYSQTVALIGQKDALGIGKLLELDLESEYTVRAQGTLYVASYAVTQKYLRPESLIELKVSTGALIV